MKEKNISMGNNMNELLLGQVKKHFGSIGNLPTGLKNIIQDINNTYINFETEIKCIQHSIEAHNPAEEALKIEQYLMDALMKNIPDHIYFKDHESRFIRISHAHALSFGLTDPKQVIGKTDFDFFSEEHARQAYEDEQKIIRTGQPISLEEKQTWPDRPDTWVATTKMPLRDKNDKIIGTFGISKDITKRKQAEIQLKESENLQRSLLENVAVGIVIIDPASHIIELINSFASTLIGESQANIIGNKCHQFISSVHEQNDPVCDKDPDTNKCQEVDNSEGVLLRIDKPPLAILRTIKRIQIGGKEKLLVSFVDISVQKKAEEASQLSSKKLEAIISASPDGIGIISFDGKMKFVSDNLASMYGFTVEQKIAISDQSIFSFIDPSNHGILKENILKLLASGGGSKITEYLTVRRDKSRFYADSNSTILYDSKGDPASILFIQRDVTQRKKAEEALIQAKIEADLGNKAKSEFLANMSHEIRTPLNGVIGFTELLQKTPLNTIQRQYAENVSTSGLALLGIINDILDFSKIEAGKMELDCIKTDIIELVEQASDIIKYHASQKGLELLLNIPHNMPRFAVLDPIRLKQILVNLLSNAVKFTQSGEIELKVIFTKKDEIKGNFSFSVQDTGIGINDEQQKRLFKAFTQADSSTTRKFGGSGLGLTISNMLAEKMGSKIEIISEPEKGSNFFFTIETEYEDGEKLHDGSLDNLHRIMVIDDNDNNRMILEHTFNNWDIEFVGVNNGLSALNVIEHSKPFDAIIVDYHMPYLNGIDTIKMIREKLNLSPETLPIMLLHSSSDDIELYEDCKRLGVRFNLTKPVKSKELLHYLKNIHNQPGSEDKELESAQKRDASEITNNSSMVVLVAEDVVLNMILVTTIITLMLPNVTILEAKNGKEAFDMAIANNPDLILMDVQMPEMDGIESTIEIRNHEKNSGRRIPIIALTAEVVKGEKEKCLEAGMDDFLTKPIEQNALREVLGKYLTSLTSKPDHAQEMNNLNNEELHFDRIKLMESIGNSQLVFKELIEAIPHQFSDDMEWLEISIIEKKMEDARKAVHSIKGASLGMYFNQMGKLAIDLEMSIANKAFERLDGQFNELTREWEQVQSILKNL